MANPFPVTSLTFDGTSLQRLDGSVLFEIKRGLGDIPSVRGVDQIVPGRRGRIRRNRIADALTLELEGVVDAGDLAEFAVLRQELHDLFDPEAGDLVLSCLLEDGTTATINALVVPPMLWDEKAGHARVNVALESVDPDWDFS